MLSHKHKYMQYRATSEHFHFALDKGTAPARVALIPGVSFPVYAALISCGHIPESTGEKLRRFAVAVVKGRVNGIFPIQRCPKREPFKLLRLWPLSFDL